MTARVLVVEDNPANLQLMLYLLRAFGHEATAAQDGVSGLSCAQTTRFDLILCDVQMPGIDGYEFARRFKAGPGLRPPLVAVTALAMVGDKEKLIAGGFDGYISKPITPETFVSEIECFLPAEFHSGKTQAAPSTAEAPSNRKTGPVILAVDDIQVNLDLIRSTLEPFGYEVLEAHNVVEGIDVAQITKPSLILCDLHMAGGDGFELLNNVKTSSELHDVPFFFLSSTAWRPTEQIRGMQLGATKFILRPIDPMTLRNEIARAISGEHGDDTRR
jgi:two-component system cell cycle response regulator